MVQKVSSVFSADYHIRFFLWAKTNSVKNARIFMKIAANTFARIAVPHFDGLVTNSGEEPVVGTERDSIDRFFMFFQIIHQPIRSTVPGLDGSIRTSYSDKTAHSY